MWWRFRMVMWTGWLWWVLIVKPPPDELRVWAAAIAALYIAVLEHAGMWLDGQLQRKRRREDSDE